MANGKNVVGLLRSQIATARQWLEGTMENVTLDQAHWIPPGTALPIGATYAHVVVGQDGMVNGTLSGKAPLFASSFAGKTGLSELPPGPEAGKPGFPDWTAWSRKVTIDLVAFSAYAKAVFEATDSWLGTLSDSDLARSIDLSALGLGAMTLESLLTNGVLGNALAHCGEISCLKGLQGKRGYAM